MSSENSRVRSTTLGRATLLHCVVVSAVTLATVAAAAMNSEAADPAGSIPLSSRSKWPVSVALSRDGAHALTGGGDSVLRLWDTATGRLVRTFTGHTRELNSLAFSPDGSRVLSGGYDDTAKLWNVGTGELLRTFKAYVVSSVAFSRDGARALTGSFDLTIKLWDLGSGELIRTFEGCTLLYRHFGCLLAPRRRTCTLRQLSSAS
jgi:WD40 repeat protein